MEEIKTNNIVFSADKITSYWKNQTPHTDSGMFSDKYFPADLQSLRAQDSDGIYIDKKEGETKAEQINLDEIEWKRASEIFDKYMLFEEKIEFSDIKQGNLGNCYFLSAIAAITEFPQLIYQIFRTKEINVDGYYEIVLYIDGEWRVVFVDDYFPVIKETNEFTFARPNGNEIWVLLLEKAWAKINGGYANIISGWPSDPLAALTGFSTQKLNHKEINQEELWEILKTSDQEDSIMCTSTKSDSICESMGLVANHAYTLIGAKETIYNGEALRLVKIRNPWGHKEWSGDWSDNSSLWTSELKQFYDYLDEDDGTFYMSIIDFIRLYECTHVCHVMYDSNIKSFKIESDALQKPHVFNLYIQENSRVAISIITKHWRYNRDLRYITHPFSLVIAKYNSKTQKFTNVEGEYLAYEDIEYVKFLTMGLYVIWIYCAFEYCVDPKPEEYKVRFISSTKYRVRLKNYDTEFDLIKEMITAGFLEKYESEIETCDGFLEKIENSFKRSGIGYRCVFNKSPILYQKWTNDSTQIQKMFMFPPHQRKEEFVFWVPPESVGICLGMRTDQWGTYWFNVPSSFSTKKCKQGEDPTKTFKVNLQHFLSADVSSDVVENNYYNYISSSNIEAKKELKFKNKIAKSNALEDLKNQYPDLINTILVIPGPDDDNYIWIKQILDNGYYIGQLSTQTKNRHGRGIYFWSNELIYYSGYWENNIRTKWGKVLDKDLNIIYKGDYLNGVKHGQGEFYFTNGDCYKGEYLNDKRHGKGIFEWADGSKWHGLFENGKMNGKGIFYNSYRSDHWQAEYRNNQVIY